MNSSASVITSTLSVPDSARLAMRKMGIRALRLRTVRSSSVASPMSWTSLPLCVQLSRMQWMLESDTTVSAVSRRVGYSSPFTFSTAFKRAYGRSPSEYRGARPGAVRAAAGP